MTSSQAIDRLRRVIRRQHKSLSTEQCYVFWLRRYMATIEKMPPGLSSEQKLERFLTAMAQQRDVSVSTQNQAFNAIVFFFREVLEKPLGDVNALRAKAPIHERRAPTITETKLLLGNVKDEGGYPTRLIVKLLYGCGLRVTELLNLRVKDVNLERGTLFIRGAKGGKGFLAAVCSVAAHKAASPGHIRASVGRRPNGLCIIPPDCWVSPDSHRGSPIYSANPMTPCHCPYSDGGAEGLPP